MTTPPSPSSPPAPWHVLGAGAIGGLQALRLVARGQAVVLLARDGAPSRTLALREEDQERIHTFAQRRPGATGPITRLLVATKSQQAAAALAPVLPDLAPGAVVVLLQNGMGAEAALLARRPDLRVLVAVTTDGVFRPARDTLVLAGRGDTLLGPLRAADAPLARDTAADLGMAFAPDIERRRWLKLAMNCAINPLTALQRCSNGELLDRPDALATMREVCAEVAAVMRAEGLEADGGALFDLACETARRTAANLSSMRVDADAGRETEIRFLNDFVAARGRARGIPTPANARLVAAVEALRPAQA